MKADKNTAEITIQELRIGNYVFNGFDQLIQINFISGNYNVAGYRICTLKPILLTEEWLVKFGFKGNELISKHLVFVFYHKNNLAIKGMLGMIKPFECKYVHQLQNLYWCLCGEELTLNEKL